MTERWATTKECREFLDSQGIRVYWDPVETRGVLVGCQAVGLPPMMLMTPQGLWLAPDEYKTPAWWGSEWDFAHNLEPFPDADVPELIQEVRRQYYGRIPNPD